MTNPNAGPVYVTFNKIYPLYMDETLESKWFQIGKYAFLLFVNFFNFEAPSTKLKIETFWENN
jgi:hypothetical protein